MAALFFIFSLVGAHEATLRIGFVMHLCQEAPGKTSSTVVKGGFPEIPGAFRKHAEEAVARC